MQYTVCSSNIIVLSTIILLDRIGGGKETFQSLGKMILTAVEVPDLERQKPRSRR